MRQSFTMRFHQLKKQKLPLWLAWALPPWHSLQQKHLWNQNKKDQCQNSINFKHITKLLFFSFLLFPNTIKKQEQWFCIYEAKNKIFSKNYNIKKKRKKPRMRRRRRRVRTEERSVEFEDREFEKEELRQFVVLVVPYEQPWWIRYYVVVWCRRDITVTTLTAAATQTLFLCLFTDASSASASHCTFSKIKRTTKKRSNFFVLRFWVKNKVLRVCLFVCFLVFEFYFWFIKQRNEERDFFGDLVCTFVFVLFCC